MKRVFKLIVLPITVVTFILFLGVMSFADEVPSLTVKNPSLSDEEYSIEIYADSCKGLTELDITVSFDGSILKTDGVSTENTDIADINVDIDSIIPDEAEDSVLFFYDSALSDNGLRIAGYFLEPIEDADSLHIFNLTFSLKEAVSDNCIISISSVMTAGLTSTQNIKLLVKDNTQRITELQKPRAIGDTNGDGEVTSQDARNLLRCSVGLEDVGISDFPYSDTDYDGELTSSDARFALRAAVGLEDKIYHCFEIKKTDGKSCDEGGEYEYICRITDKRLSFEADCGEHLYNDNDCCNRNICLICGRKSDSVAAGHNYDESGFCTSCFAVKQVFDETKESLFAILDEAAAYDETAQKALSSGDTAKYFNYTLAATSLLKDAGKICEGVTGFEFTAAYVKDAYAVRIKAIFECTDSDGMIEASKANASAVSQAVRLSENYLSLINR